MNVGLARSGCPICGDLGYVLYRDLEDFLFGAPGRWTIWKCKRDGLLWLDPRPSAPALAAAYISYSTHDTPAASRSDVGAAIEWVRKAIRFSWLSYELPRRSWLARIAGSLAGSIPTIRDGAAAPVLWLPGGSPGTLLDLGSGDGRFVERMRGAGWDAVGVEPDPVAAAESRRRYGVRILVGTLEDIDLRPESFDAITASHVIEHVDSPVATLASCRRLLKPGGRLVVLTPNADSLVHRSFGVDWRGLEPPRHLHIFTRRSLGRCAALAGFEASRVSIRSTARAALWMWRQSKDLRHIRRGTAGPEERFDQLRALALMARESIATESGEELLLSATK